jgi:hypothetical protein
MKNTQQLLASLFEGKKEEYDNEGDMAKDQLFTIADAAEEIHDMLEDDTNLPEWVQNKITKAADYLDSVRDYLSANAVDDDDMEDDMNESKTLTVQKATDSVAKVLGQNSANKFINYLKPGTNKSVTWDQVNTALVKQGVKPQHIAKISINALKEEVEKIDEVSTKTLSSYLRKAASSSDNVKKRLPGVQKAADKLNKKTAGMPKVGPHAPMRGEEVEQVDEISKKTLGSYVKKAQRDMSRSASSAMLHKQLAKDGDSTQDKYAKDATKDMVKRRKGIDKAVDRLTKEDVDHDICPECNSYPCECNNIHEKLSVSDGMGAWITDFKKSDAPQFKGKDEKERRDMAIAAFMSAKRDQKEQVQESTDKDYIEQKLADADINALVKGSTVMVDKADLLKAKAIVKKLGYNYKVMPGLNA